MKKILTFISLLFSLSLSLNAKADWWMPDLGLTWDIQLTGALDLNADSDAYDVDLFDTSKEQITEFKNDGHIVICYMSAGSYENWRPDAKSFPKSVKGRSNGWAGEQWLDIRKTSILKPIMSARMDLAVSKGCDAIDADNVDGYSNKTGFALKASHQLTYNRLLATLAHERNLSIGLKNDLLQISALQPNFDFSINESCFDYDECDYMQPFIDAGKPVLAIDYSGDNTRCIDANAMDFSMILKDNLLSEPGIGCWE